MAKLNPMILKTLRLWKGWSQERLAEMAKVNKQTISRIERRSEPCQTRENTIKRLALALSVEPAELMRDALAPEGQPSELTKRRRQSGFGVSRTANNFLYLISERYFVRPWQVMELAPLLFCWAAEMSLRERRRRLNKLEEACETARAIEKEMQHLPPPNLMYSEEKIAAEARSIEAHDIFGMCFGDDDFSDGLVHSFGDDVDNPFAVFLSKLTEEMGEMTSFESFSPIDYPIFQVCRNEARDMVNGDETLAKRILTGVVDLYDMPKDLQGVTGNADKRAVWVREQADAFFNAHNEAAKRRKKSGAVI
ncbi:helix-turn-helix domain-containing protein [Bradyrhizobium canariense]|uniref:helix-turn-helix domain-containing protein n=1 Tax=Bradyrhizobium canariense TaxID=255045 RepID=UPI001B89F816|nr:helix-turn-helix transcriptional regulator [Bradyrhizobium canariense]MBR0951681.1 helix-turn-helix transcriptional regulator [Bradyrhizobium canariense]